MRLISILFSLLFSLLFSPSSRATNVSVEIEIADYGAIPDDGEDDTESIAQALSQLSKRGGNAKLIFKKGVYNLTSRNLNYTHIFSINGLSNFTIDGAGSMLIIDNPAVGFMSVTDCHNGEICNIKIDYKTVPFAQGKIISVDKESTTYTFLQDSIAGDLDGDNFKKSVTRWAIPFTNQKPLRLRDNAPNLIPFLGAELIGHEGSQKIYRVQTSNHIIDQLKAGWSLAIIARYNGRSTFMINNCSSLTLKSNTYYSGPAGSCNMRNSDNVSILECRVLRKEGRLISQNADCIHILPAKKGPRIEGCIFEGQMDDAINMKSELMYIKQVVAPNRYVVKGRVDIGDTLALFNPREGLLIGYCKVLTATGEEITVDNKFYDLQIGQDKKCDMFFNLNRRNSGFVIKNNIFRGSRRYAMLIQSANGEISSNTMQNISTGAITLENNAYWPEGFTPKNINITNNTIDNCGFDASYWREGKNCAPIILRTMTYKKEAAKWQGVRDIRVENNIIQTNSDKAFFLQSVKNVKLRNNIISGGHENPIHIENSQTVSVE